MSRARNLWWGYVRNILREYPRVTAEEHRAVSAAIQTTRTRRDGVERMRVVRMTHPHPGGRGGVYPVQLCHGETVAAGLYTRCSAILQV